MNPADPIYLQQAIKQLRRKGVRFLPGLTDKEVQVVESRWAFKFPLDWCAFLKIAMPDWINWRSEKDADIRAMEKRFSWAMDTIVPGVEQSSFWMPEWGNRPENPQEVKSVIKSLIESAPKLIPIRGHRFIPSKPHEPGNPVFSVYGIDTVYMGYDLAGYLATEFGINKPEWSAKRPKKIDFWWQFDELNEFNSSQ